MCYLYTNSIMSLRASLPETFTMRQARRAGWSKAKVYQLRDTGKIETIGRGLFRLSGATLGNEDLAEIAARATRATLCLMSALVRHELSDEIPEVIDVALPRGTRSPATSAIVSWHFFDAETFDVGREWLTLTKKTRVGLYSPERCLVDAFRIHPKDAATVEALKRWIRRRGSQPSQLLDMAKRFPRAEGPIRRALEILL
jgi:predicted transcriptional regulator of viral defense system